MRLVAVVALAVAACGGDGHEAIEHHHEPLPKLKHLTGIERDELRTAVMRGIARAKIASDDVIPQAGVAGDLHVVFDDFETTGPLATSSVIQPAVHMIENCLGAIAVTGRFSLDVARSGRVTTAIVLGVGSHDHCVQDVLAALTFPSSAMDYIVRAKIVYK